MNTRFELIGDKNVERLFRGLEGRTQKNVLRKGTRAGMKPIAQKIRASAPTTEIKKALGRKSKTYGKDGVVAIFYGTKGKLRGEDGELIANKAHDAEYGTKHDAPSPFIRPAFDETVRQGERAAREAIAKGVEDEARKLGGGA